MWTAPLLASSLFVLSAFFITAAVATLAGVELATLLTVLLPAALLATGRTIILRITTRRMLSTALTAALFHTLVPLSIVCHINPPDLFVK